MPVRHSPRLDAIHGLVEAEMDGLPVMAHDPSTGLPLQVVSYGAAEVLEALDAMLSTRVTMGDRVRAFEAAWAEACGAEHAIMVNSGSSANLLAWAAMVQAGILRRGDEVVVPAVGWSTTLFPILQAGLRAVLVDVDPDTLCLDPGAARSAIRPETRAVCVVHLLGCPADMDAIGTLGLPIMEDSCAAHGARLAGIPVGGIGMAGTFSFFFSHHVTTVEGGILVTHDAQVADLARSLRAHGWIREMSCAREMAARWPDIDARFLFVSPGYNLRPTEMAAGFGLHQLARLPGFVASRRCNHADWCARIAASGLPLRVFPEPAGSLHSAFAFPLLLSSEAPCSRADLMAWLEARGISTRPISGSNLARQPAVRGLEGVRVASHLPVADSVHDRGFFVGQSHAFGPAHGTLLLEALREFFDAR